MWVWIRSHAGVPRPRGRGSARAHPPRSQCPSRESLLPHLPPPAPVSRPLNSSCHVQHRPASARCFVATVDAPAATPTRSEAAERPEISAADVWLRSGPSFFPPQCRLPGRCGRWGGRDAARPVGRCREAANPRSGSAVLGYRAPKRASEKRPPTPGVRANACLLMTARGIERRWLQAEPSEGSSPVRPARPPGITSPGAARPGATAARASRGAARRTLH
jgi:hypothetical protein